MNGADPPPLLLATAASLLEIGRTIDRIATPLTIVAFAGLLATRIAHAPLAAMFLLLLAAASGLGQAYFAARVAFDAALFRRLADGDGKLAALDEALVALALLPARKVGREFGERFAGAKRLLRNQSLSLGVQAIALTAAGLCWA